MWRICILLLVAVSTKQSLNTNFDETIYPRIPEYNPSSKTKLTDAGNGSQLFGQSNSDCLILFPRCYPNHNPVFIEFQGQTTGDFCIRLNGLSFHLLFCGEPRIKKEQRAGKDIGKRRTYVLFFILVGFKVKNSNSGNLM